MSEYQVVRLGGKYKARQARANALGCVCYVEHHFNALEYDKTGTGDNPALVLVADNASAKSRAWGKRYASDVAAFFGNRNGGLLERSAGQAGYYNLVYTSMPAILVEPLFVSDSMQAMAAMSFEGQDVLAQILADSIRAEFPEGGKVGMSVGHVGNREGDRGAPAKVDGKIVAWESDLAEQVMMRAAWKLSGGA